MNRMSKDNGWILTADQIPEQNRPVMAVWVMEEDWFKATLRRDGKWYGEADQRELREPLKWRYPWPEPQEDTGLELQCKLKRNTVESGKYRRTPSQPVEAMQYTEETREEVIAFCGAQSTAIGEDGGEYELLNLRIGNAFVGLGDWVIKLDTEFAVQNDEGFTRDYDPI